MKGVVGKAYVFRWLELGEFTGVCTHTGKAYSTLRTRKNSFSVPHEDVLRDLGWPRPLPEDRTDLPPGRPYA